MEGIRFEFTNLSCLGNLVKTQTGGAYPPAAAFRLHAGFETATATILAVAPSSRRRDVTPQNSKFGR
jgi:hypothetical protein